MKPNLTKTMKHPPTCHNCTTYGTPKCPDCAFKKYDTLCIEHPRIREYLMQDVVKELNQREHNLGMHLTEREKGKCDGYNEAIALIQDGVK